MKRDISVVFPSITLEKLDDVFDMTDVEVLLSLEKNGYKFKELFQVKDCFIHRQVAGSDVLISVGANIANFNGYIQLNDTASFLWDKMKEPQMFDELVELLEKKYELQHRNAVEDIFEFLKKLVENDMVNII